MAREAYRIQLAVILIAANHSVSAQETRSSEVEGPKSAEFSSTSIPESCRETDPIIAAGINRTRFGLRETEAQARAVQRALQEILGDDYTDDHPELIEARLEVREQQQRLDTWQQSCIERVRREGEFVPNGLTIDEWKQVKSEIQRYYRAFGVGHSAIGPIPSEGCPNASPPTAEVERWANRSIPDWLPPCSLTVDIHDWDAFISLHFVRESGRWVRVFMPGQR